MRQILSKKFLGFCAALIVAVVAAVFAGSWFAIDWDESPSAVFPGGTVLRDSRGNVLRVSLGPDDVDCRPYYTASPDDWIVKAIVASEDGTFFSHCGVRPFSMLRAAWQNVTSGRRVSGASTITMQTVRLIEPHRKSYFQKWVEAFKAMKMERRRDKIWIMSQYLNRAPFGSNFIGIEAAANGWFGKGAKDLGLGEAALLAGMVQAPSRFRPDRRYEKAVKRRDYVLSRMVATGAATPEQAEAARGVVPSVCRSPRPFKAPFYCDWYAAEVLGAGRDGDPSRGDVATPLDPRLQEICERAVEEASRNGDLPAAAAIAKVATGEIVALAVSGDYFDRKSGQVNTAVAPRSAGSTLKPFLAALAMDLSLAYPGEMLPDVPMPLKGYSPSDFDGKYRGLASLGDSLVQSLNIPFVHILSRVGVERFAGVLRSQGFGHIGDDASRHGLGMAIGNVNATLVELCRAYAAFAHAASTGVGGAYSRESAYVVTDILSGSQRSRAALGHSADVKTPRFAWKTGTSSACRDAWTVAWNPEYAVGVWRGRLSGASCPPGTTGASAAAPVAWSIARAIYPSGEGPWFVEPGGLSKIRICTVSGLPASALCPSVRTASIPPFCGTRRLCGVHRAGPDGKTVERFDPAVEAFFGRGSGRIVISKPASGTVFETVPGIPGQKIACAAAGVAEGEKIWWFLDGRFAGESESPAGISIEMIPGRHELACAASSGETATSEFDVRSGDPADGQRGK